ncbi:hypothetical protein Tco_0554139 [Tanacetum coccineum]
MDLFNLIKAPNPTKVKTGTRPRAAHEVPLLTATASRVIGMEDPVMETESSGTPSAIEKSPLDFDNENPSQQITESDVVFPTVVDSRINAPKDEMPVEGSYSVEDVAILNTQRTPIQKQPEPLLCLVGLSRRYFLGDDVYHTFLYDDDRDMDLFNLIKAPNPTKMKTGTRPRAAHEVPLLNATTSRVIGMEDPATETESSGTLSAI